MAVIALRSPRGPAGTRTLVALLLASIAFLTLPWLMPLEMPIGGRVFFVGRREATRLGLGTTYTFSGGQQSAQTVHYRVVQIPNELALLREALCGWEQRQKASFGYLILGDQAFLIGSCW